MSQPPPSPASVSIWVKAGVLTLLFLIVSWALPAPVNRDRPQGTEWILWLNFKFRTAGWHSDGRYISPVTDFMLLTGLWQSWNMFAPNPVRDDYFFEAELQLVDGETEVHSLKRLYEMPLLSRYGNERYRKFFEKMRPESGSWLWPRLAQRAIVWAGREPREVEKVTLILRNRRILPPDQPQLTEYDSTRFFEWLPQAK